jgi:hypothetical protein
LKHGRRDGFTSCLTEPAKAEARDAGALAGFWPTNVVGFTEPDLWVRIPPPALTERKTAMTNTKPSPVVVDANHLDQEWVRQPSHMLSATEAEADADYEHAKAKAAFELVEAELFLAVKFTPSEYDLDEKPSLDVIKSKVITLPKYQAAQSKAIEAKHRKDIMASRVTALAHKRTSIENLTMLESICYHSEPRATSNEVRESVNRAKERGAFKPIEARRRKGSDG